MLKEHFGALTLTELEDPDGINRFKADSEYSEGVEIATMHRVLETLRAAKTGHGADTAAVQPFAVRSGARASAQRASRP